MRRRAPGVIPVVSYVRVRTCTWRARRAGGAFLLQAARKVGKARRIYHRACEWFMLRATMIAPRFRSKTTLAWMIALSLVAAGPLYAQQLDTIQIRDNVWVIFGAGGNVTVHVGEDGVMLVDSGSEPMAEKTLEAVRAITKA